jgi:uncharacterized protein YciI
MFIVMLDYIQPLAEVDKHLAAHQEYLQQQFDKGAFLVSGPKEPRTGGVILASADSLDTLQATLALDPFKVHGIATYEVIQFTARAAAKGLEQLIGA